MASATYTISGPKALLVVGNTTLNASDAALRTRLQNRGFAVTVKLDSASAASDASNFALILVSETSTAANVAAKFLSVAVPVILLEPAIQDDMKMTGTAWDTDLGTMTETRIDVQSAAGALAAGLSGNTTVVTASRTLIWGIPVTSATVIAKIVSPTSTKRATIYKYEKGASLVSGTAAGKRAAFFAHGSTAASLNANGWALFDALVNWAVPPLAAVPAAFAPLLIKEVQLRPMGCIEIVWDSLPGQRYQLETATQLDPASWVSVGPEIISENRTTIARYCPGESGPAQFYRVRTLP